MEKTSQLIEELIRQIMLSESKFDEGEGNVDLANKASDAAVAIRDQIWSVTGGNMFVLKPLLEHSNASVRSWTAAELLPVCEDKAKDVLAEVAEQPGFVGITARFILQEWEKGNWMGKQFDRNSSR